MEVGAGNSQALLGPRKWWLREHRGRGSDSNGQARYSTTKLDWSHIQVSLLDILGRRCTSFRQVGFQRVWTSATDQKTDVSEVKFVS